jgi:phenylalanyl-tRNA synthetase beta chain
MIISYNWLKEYIDFKESPEELAVILTDIGLEVSSIENYSSIEGELEGLVIGKVKTCDKHPDADKLSITTVDVGGDRDLPIVCGAPNVAVGQTVVVASVGTIIYPINGESFKIKKAKIRGQVSEGMICAEDEIGIGTSHDGIMVLPDNLKQGTPAADYFNIEKDVAIEIDLTPNRIDAASHIGVARDLAAYFSKEKQTKIKLKTVDNFKPDNNELPISVEIENTQLCPRYMGVTLKNINIEPSPDWLQNRLTAVGLHPINNIVDITNYVMLETGHPLHAFDVNKIEGNKIKVKTLKQGSTFKTLDGEERLLSNTDLMICNQKEAMCIAGVFGGIESGISDITKSVFIESAYFNPVSVRKTARLHGLNTDSSFRFERGADINMAPYALKRAALMIKEIAGGSISSDIVDIYPNKIKEAEIEVKYANINRLIGKTIDKEIIKKILTGLEITIISEDAQGLKLSIPTYRVDVTREADVIEDILRIYGYNNVEEPSQLRASLSYTDYPDKEKLFNIASLLLNGNGFSEIMCTSISKRNYYNNTVLENLIVDLHNPLSNDLNCMRGDIIYGGLESISRNIRHQQTDAKFFEFGNIYRKKYPNVEINLSKSYIENPRLGLWITGTQHGINWAVKEKNVDVFQLKSFVELLLERFGINISKLDIEESDDYRFEYGLNYFINKNLLVSFGRVADDLLKQTDINQEIFFADVLWDELIQIAKNNSVVYKPMSKFPRVRRDLALLIDKNVSYKQLKELAEKTERNYLKEIRLFDVYEGKNLPEGKKSYAIMFILQDVNKTMTDKQIDKIMQRLIDAYLKEIGAEIR